MNKTGIKIGSQNTAIARRDENGEINTTYIKTCVRYPKGILKNSDVIVGDAAAEFVDVKYPLRFGVVETEEGVKQLEDILRIISIPPESDIVIASPAVSMKKENGMLAEAIRNVYSPKLIVMFSEGLCSAIYISSIDFINTEAFFSLNLGSSTLELGCFNEGNEIYLSAHPEVCGNRVDMEITKKIGNLIGDAIISDKSIREMKENTSLSNPKTYTVEGMTRHGKKEVQLSEEIITPLKEYANNVADIFCNEIIGAVNPIVRNIALKSPLFISGGMSNIPGMPELITELIYEKMNHRFEIKYSPEGDNHLTAAKGALILAENI